MFLLRSWSGVFGSRRHRTLLLSIVVSSVCALLFYVNLDHVSPYLNLPNMPGRQPSAPQKPLQHLPPGHFHLLVPASNSNLDFCRLLLSSTILGYPTPVLINWNATAGSPYDTVASHVAKIRGLLRYLDHLPPTHDDDLVLIADAYDIWFQLPSSVLLQRYHDLVQRTNQRIIDQYGQRATSKWGIRNTVLFGPDKTCWPYITSRPACWAIPSSTLPTDIFGPDTDNGDMVHDRPRWLNSGTIMGPVKDVRDMIRGAMELVDESFDPVFEYAHSDQYYFANLFGLQSLRRLQLLLGEAQNINADLAKMLGQPREQETEQQAEPQKHARRGEGARSRIKRGGADAAGVEAWSHRDIPELNPHRRYEYHIFLDYESELFQTNAGWYETLVWKTFNRTQAEGETPQRVEFSPNSPPEKQGHIRALAAQVPFPEDINDAKPPFINVPVPKHRWGDPPSNMPPRLPTHKSWRDVSLGTNPLTRVVFPLLHLTGYKEFRELWWNRMWFFPWAETLLRTTVIAAKQSENQDRIVAETGDGRKWKNMKEEGETELLGARGGVWSEGVYPHQGLLETLPVDDAGRAEVERPEKIWHPWEEVCKEHEDWLFGRKHNDVSYPTGP